MMPVEIPHLLEAAGGEIVGKVRLQKVVYLLDQLGMHSGFSYEYHHYGPYSAELAKTIDENVFSREIEEAVHRRASDGVPYSIFRTGPGWGQKASVGVIGDLPFEQAQRALAAMHQRSSTVLELASTIHWLVCVERASDWRTELVRRKGIKAAQGRVEEAIELLTDVGLPITKSPA
jgi:uncharacterized protein